MQLCVVLLCALCVFRVLGQRQETGARADWGQHSGDRIQVQFTPSVCKVRCVQGRCVNICDKGELSTVFSSDGDGQGNAFRVFLCPLLCKNGGLCLQKDRCLCPPNFTGKFCQISLSSNTSSTSHAPPSASQDAGSNLLSVNQELTRSEFLLPLGLNQETQSAGAPSPHMVKVRVQHPPEANVQVHQVLKVPASSLRSLTSGSAGFPAPVPRGVQAQTSTGTGTYSQNSGFKYCFREAKDGQCSSPLPGLRSRDTCCRGVGKAWGIDHCELCPNHTDKGNSSCPVGFQRVNGTKCEAHSVISEEKGRCFRMVSPLSSPSSCSLPILRSITKQICCCSRVGKAWGEGCQRCPPFGSAAFKEICPAGPGYHYSASALQFTQRAIEQLGHRGAPLLPSSSTHNSREQDTPGVGRSPPRPQQTGGGQTLSHPRGPVTMTTTKRPTTTTTKRPVTVTTKRLVTTTKKPPGVRGTVGACESRPGVCGRGLCVNQPMGRHSCVCHRGYHPNALNTSCHDTDECALSPCDPNAHCENSPGSFKCVCYHGYKLRGEVCTDVDECEDPLLCPGQECVNSAGSYRCVSCRPGFGLLHRLCTDIDECRQAPCTNGRCENTLGSYRCICRHGYRLHNNTCSDIDECADPSQCPGQMCVNTAGSYRCVSCRHGYRFLNRQCIDINECEERQPCPGQKCVNSEGSYSCVSCSEGYSSVSGVCTDIDECADPSQCPGQMCVNSMGSYRCVSCRHGYSTRNGSCHDVDECSVPGACPSDRVCVNSEGSFKCDCAPGYSSGLGRSCRDIDECLQGGRCSGGDCVNTLGSFSCVCIQGYSLSSNGTSCSDVDECSRPGVCEHGRCLNSPGSFYCDCDSGFSPSPERNACLDVDECLSSLGSVCGSQRCENTIGSYRCLAPCRPGYQTSPSGSCEDVDECSAAQVCGAHSSCVNLIGAFQCQCDQGYSSAPDGRSCEASPVSAPSDGSTSVSSNSSHSTGSSHLPEGFSHLSTSSSHSSARSTHSSRGSSLSTGFSHHTTGSSPSPTGSSHSTDSSYSFTGSSHSFTGSSHSSTDSTHSSTGSTHSSTGSSHSPTGSSHSSTGSSHSPTGSSNSPTGSSHSSTGSSNPPAGSSHSVDSSSGSFPPVDFSLPPDDSSLPPAGREELRECYYALSERGVCSVLSSNTTLQECCCTEGQGWGRSCVYHTCPYPQTAEFQALCPNGRGYVTTGSGAFNYKDVDECKRFGPEVCKSGVCVNNIPGFSCYCPSGYVFNRILLQCTDHDECEEESCSGGVCVNTEGSFYCSCPHPLVLDDTQRTCVNATDQSPDEHVSLCWQTVSADLLCQSLLLGAQLSFSDCCCLYGQGWGMECALCPQPDTEDYATLCSSVHSPFYPHTFSDSEIPTGSRPGSSPGPARGGAPVPYFPPFTSELYPPLDYDQSVPAGGARERFDHGYRGPPYGGGYFPEPDYDPDQTRPESSFNPDARFSSDTRFSPDSSFTSDGSRFSPETRFSPDSRFSLDSGLFLVPPDPRSEQAFEVQPPAASEPEEPWRGFPPFTRPGPRRLYDSLYCFSLL